MHYNTVNHVFKYLRDTIDFSFHYWIPEDNKNNESCPFPEILNDNHNMAAISQVSHFEPYVYVDSDWEADEKIRKSVTGLVVMLAGAPIAYKIKSQTILAHSTTEVEFATATDCVKTALYLRNIFEEIILPPRHATVIYEDNAAAIKMYNAQRPTRCTKHM